MPTDHARRVQRNTLTYAQMQGQGHGRRVQRNTLTYAQMEGKGIWDTIKKFIKKHKIISRVLGGLSLASKFVPIPGASMASLPLGIAGTASGMAGYGMHGGAMSGKGVTKAQLDAIRSGLGHWMPSGGISLASAKYLYPRVKNIMPSQVRSLASGLGRMVKSGGISLRGGKHSGMYHNGCIRRLHPPMMKLVGSGYSGRGVKLAGQGVSLAGRGRRQGQKKKQVKRMPPMTIYRY